MIEVIIYIVIFLFVTFFCFWGCVGKLRRTQGKKKEIKKG